MEKHSLLESQLLKGSKPHRGRTLGRGIRFCHQCFCLSRYIIQNTPVIAFWKHRNSSVNTYEPMYRLLQHTKKYIFLLCIKICLGSKYPINITFYFEISFAATHLINTPLAFVQHPQHHRQFEVLHSTTVQAYTHRSACTHRHFAVWSYSTHAWRARARRAVSRRFSQRLGSVDHSYGRPWKRKWGLCLTAAPGTTLRNSPRRSTNCTLARFGNAGGTLPSSRLALNARWDRLLCWHGSTRSVRVG